MSKAFDDVLAERRRQRGDLGYTADHDDEHTDGSLALAGAYYAILGADDPTEDLKALAGRVWPSSWDDVYRRPKDPRRNLVRAAALLIAEIERLDRITGNDTIDSPDHGMVLTDQDCHYQDLTEYGTVTIGYSHQHGARVTVSGFKFLSLCTCRQRAAKATAWARDVLTQQLEATKLVPGGRISGGID